MVSSRATSELSDLATARAGSDRRNAPLSGRQSPSISRRIAGAGSAACRWRDGHENARRLTARHLEHPSSSSAEQQRRSTRVAESEALRHIRGLTKSAHVAWRHWITSQRNTCCVERVLRCSRRLLDSNISMTLHQSYDNSIPAQSYKWMCVLSNVYHRTVYLVFSYAKCGKTSKWSLPLTSKYRWATIKSLFSTNGWLHLGHNARYEHRYCSLSNINQKSLCAQYDLLSKSFSDH